MAGLTGYKNITDGLFAQLVQAEKNVKIDAQEAMLEATIAGEEKVKWVIDHTPSDLSNTPKDNRNWTFRMNNAVDSEVTRNGNTITGRIGWLKDQEFYFLMQEDGGDVNGKHITPMNALMAGQVEMLKTLTRWGLKTT